MSKRLALLLTVALMGALVACQPAGSRCVEWGIRYEKQYVFERGKKSRVEYKSVPHCTRYEVAK